MFNFLSLLCLVGWLVNITEKPDMMSLRYCTIARNVASKYRFVSSRGYSLTQRSLSSQDYIPKPLRETVTIQTEAEDYLITQTDPFNHISKNFHPAIVRAFKEARSIRQPSNQFKSLFSSTETALLDINRALNSKRNWTIVRASRELSSASRASTYVQRVIPGLLKSRRSEEEIKGILALLNFFIPPSKELWLHLDQYLVNHYLLPESKLGTDVASTSNELTVSADPTVGILQPDKIELGLLASYLFHNICQYNNYDPDEFQVPKLTMIHFLKAKSYLENRKKINPFQYNLPFFTEAAFDSFGRKPEVIDSKSIELLSLQIHLFSEINPKKKNNYTQSSHSTRTKEGIPPSDQLSEGRKAPASFLQSDFLPGANILIRNHPKSQLIKLEQDLSDHTLQILSSINHPIKLNSLQFIWQSLNRLNDVYNRYPIYRRLHQEIQKTILIDPFQIIHREELICSLFESMIESNLKSMMLISTIYDVLSTYGMDYERYGLRMFNALNALECIQYAPNIIGMMIHNSDINLGKVFQQIAKNGSLRISNQGKSQIYSMLIKNPALHSSTTESLTNTEESTTSSSFMNQETVLALEKEGLSFEKDHVLGYKLSNDLAIALFCFNRDQPSSPHFQILEKLETALYESEYFQKKMGPAEAVRLIRCYAFTTRRPTILFNALVDRIVPNFVDLDRNQLATLLWSFARLNYLPTHIKLGGSNLLDQIVWKYFKLVKNSSKNFDVNFLRTFWSLAVLEKLTLERYTEYEATLINFYETRHSHNEKIMSFQMLTQIYNELLLKHLEESKELFKTEDVVGNIHLPPPTSEKIPSIEKEKEGAIRKENESNETKRKIYLDEDELELATSGKITKQPVELLFTIPVPPSLQRLEKFLEKTHKAFRKLKDENASSDLHRNISKVLLLKKIPHENEILLPNYYVVDIFIPIHDISSPEMKHQYPWSEALKNNKKQKKGIVIEVDGPTHFESYAKVS